MHDDAKNIEGIRTAIQVAKGIDPADFHDFTSTQAARKMRDRIIYELSRRVSQADAVEAWQKLLATIDYMMQSDRYQFAADTLSGIREWIVIHEHCTDAQVQAVENILTGARIR